MAVSSPNLASILQDWVGSRRFNRSKRYMCTLLAAQVSTERFPAERARTKVRAPAPAKTSARLDIAGRGRKRRGEVRLSSEGGSVLFSFCCEKLCRCGEPACTSTVSSHPSTCNTAFSEKQEKSGPNVFSDFGKIVQTSKTGLEKCSCFHLTH